MLLLLYLYYYIVVVFLLFNFCCFSYPSFIFCVFVLSSPLENFLPPLSQAVHSLALGFCFDILCDFRSSLTSLQSQRSVFINLLYINSQHVRTKKFDVPRRILNPVARLRSASQFCCNLLLFLFCFFFFALPSLFITKLYCSCFKFSLHFSINSAFDRFQLVNFRLTNWFRRNGSVTDLLYERF